MGEVEKGWGKQEKKRDDERRRSKNNWGWRSGLKTTREARAQEGENLQKTEGDRLGGKDEAREQIFPWLFFLFIPAKKDEVTFLTHFSLVPICPLEIFLLKKKKKKKKNLIVGLVFFKGFPAHLRLLVEVREPLNPICQFVSGESNVGRATIWGEVKVCGRKRNYI